MKQSKTQLVISALLARGYCEGRAHGSWVDLGFVNLRVWIISPEHARILVKHRNVVWLNTDTGRWRVGGVAYSLAKPMPRAMATSLQIEGQEALQRATRSRHSAKELGL